MNARQRKLIEQHIGARKANEGFFGLQLGLLMLVSDSRRAISNTFLQYWPFRLERVSDRDNFGRMLQRKSVAMGQRQGQDIAAMRSPVSSRPANRRFS